MLAEPWFRPEDDARVVVADGDIAGWGRIWHEPASEGSARVAVFGTIDPSRRRQGLGSLLLAWQVDRASTILAAGGRPATITADAYDWQTDAAALFRRHGFSLVRTFEELTQPLDSLPESLPPPTSISFPGTDPGTG